MRRRVGLVVLAALAVFLSGCRVDLAVRLEVAADGSGTVEVVATADEDVVDRAPGLAQDLRFDDLEDAGWKVDGPSVTDDGGITVTLTHTFATPADATSLLATLNASSGPFQRLQLVREEAGDQVTFTLSGAGRVDSGLAAFTDPDLLAAVGATPYAQDIANTGLSPSQAIGITFRADLPGKVEDSSSDPDGDDLTWTIPLDGSSVQLAATTRVAADGNHGWSLVASILLTALVVWVIGSAAFIAIVVRARNRRVRRRSGRMQPPPGNVIPPF